jgi:hypothetical protein
MKRYQSLGAFASTVTKVWLLGAFLFSQPLNGFAQEAPRDPFFGMHIHRADGGTPWPSARFGSWRLWDAYVAWPNLEPRRGQWDFSRLDRYVAFGERFGIDVLLPLGLSPTWASARPTEKSSYQPGNAAEPADIENWRRYVRTVAERYKGRVRHYDIWNEVNEIGFFSGTMLKMVELTCAAREVLKEVSPDNKVVSPSMIGAGSEPAKFEEFLRLGGKLCVDIVGYHFYVPHREPEEIVDLVRRVRQVMTRQDVGGLPLWNTESGWWLANSDGSAETGADKRWRRVTTNEGPAVVARTLILGRAAGLERFYWYAWDGNVLGLIEPLTGQLKPAAVAYGTLIRWMAGNTPLCSTNNGQWVCRLTGEGALVKRIAWSTANVSPSLRLLDGERLVAVERLDGSLREGSRPKENVSRSVELGYEPVLVITERTPK